MLFERHLFCEASAEHPRYCCGGFIELKDGRLMMVNMEYMAGNVHSEFAGDDEAPCRLCALYSTDRGRTWGGHRVLVENNPGDINVHLPAILRLKDGGILYYFVRYHNLELYTQTTFTGYINRSDDEMESFSQIAEVKYNAHGFLTLRSGRIALPYHKPVGPWGKEVLHAGAIYSDDLGHTWTASNEITLPLRGAMEPRIAQRRDGSVFMTMRTQLGNVFSSVSTDDCATWAKPQPTGLRASESMAGLYPIQDTGDMIIIWNECEEYDYEYNHCGKRTPLTVAVSKDGGETWVHKKHVETAPDYEFTNPHCYFTSYGELIIAYETSKMKIVEFPGLFGRERMSMRAIIADIEWLYSDADDVAGIM